MNPFQQAIQMLMQQIGQHQATQAAAQQAAPVVEYYGPADQRAQYFANMGLDVNGQRPAPVPQQSTNVPALVQDGVFGLQPNFNPYGEQAPAVESFARSGGFGGPQMRPGMRRNPFGGFGEGRPRPMRRQPAESLQMAQPSFGSQPAFGGARR